MDIMMPFSALLQAFSVAYPGLELGFISVNLMLLKEKSGWFDPEELLIPLASNWFKPGSGAFLQSETNI